MELTREQFENILMALIECRISRAKYRLIELHEDIILEFPTDFADCIEKYTKLVTAAYGVNPPPRIFSSAVLINLGKPEMVRHDDWAINQCIGLELVPIDVLLVADQLNQDFETNHIFSLAPDEPNRELKITYKLKHSNLPGPMGFFSDLQLNRHQEDCRFDWVDKHAPFPVTYNH